MLSPQELTLRARIGAFALHATHDSRETTAKAREAFLAKFEREVDDAYSAESFQPFHVIGSTQSTRWRPLIPLHRGQSVHAMAST